MLEWQKRDAEKVVSSKSFEDNEKLAKEATEKVKNEDVRVNPKIKSKKKSHWSDPDL